MCGRTACTLAPDVICNACSYYDAALQHFRRPAWREHPSPSSDNGNHCKYYPSANLTPTMASPVMIKDENEGRVIQPMMWGLIPPWHKGDPKSHGLSTNNARLERLSESKLYMRPLSQRKLCVILAQGFYEWKTVGALPKTTKQPFFIYMPQEDEAVHVYDSEAWKKSEWDKMKGWNGPRILMMAGLYDTWKSPEGDTLYSYSVITMDSNSTLSWLHDRMPAILETPEQVEAWISASENTPTDKILSIIKPAQKLQYYAVSTKVNNSRCRDLDCMNPITEKKKSGSQSFLENWLQKPETSETKKPREEFEAKEECEGERKRKQEAEGKKEDEGSTEDESVHKKPKLEDIKG